MSDDHHSSPSRTIRRFAWIVVNGATSTQSRVLMSGSPRFGIVVSSRWRMRPPSASSASPFVASLMRDDTGIAACPVVLVQWSDPPVTGSTYPSHTNPGYFRICFQHPDAGALFDEVRAAGHEPLSPLRLPKPGRTTGRPVFRP